MMYYQCGCCFLGFQGNLKFLNFRACLACECLELCVVFAVVHVDIVVPVYHIFAY